MVHPQAVLSFDVLSLLSCKHKIIILCQTTNLILYMSGIQFLVICLSICACICKYVCTFKSKILFTYRFRYIFMCVKEYKVMLKNNFKVSNCQQLIQ